MKNSKRSFIHVGNNLAVDFINTQAMSREGSVDLLSCIDDLHQWASEINVNVTLEDVTTDVSIDTVHAFRHSLRSLITAHINNESLPEESLLTINQYLLYTPSQEKLTMVEQRLSLQPLNEKLSIKQLLGKIASEAATLLTSPYGEHIKSCSNHKCVLMFVDTSRSKKRRWCSMDRCGNRAKANAFYHANKE